MPVVELQDGTQVEFPDSMTEDQIKGTIKRKFFNQPTTATATTAPPQDVVAPPPDLRAATLGERFRMSKVGRALLGATEPERAAMGGLPGTQVGLKELLVDNPVAVAAMGVGMLPKVAQLAVIGAFTAHNLKQLPGVVKSLTEELNKPADQQDKVKIHDLIKAGSFNVAFTALGIKGAKDLVTPEAIAPVAPLTADALKEQAATEPTTKGPEDAIQERSPETVPVEVPPEGSGEVGQGTPTAQEVALSQETGQETVTGATYTNPETGETTVAPNHPEAAAKQSVEAPTERTARETPDYGFEVTKPTGEKEVVSRDEAKKVAEASGQLLNQPETGQVHSDEIASPTQPDKPLGSVPTPEQHQADYARYQELEKRTRPFTRRGVAPPKSIDTEIQAIKNRYEGKPPPKPEPISKGPGAASPGDVPAAPKEAVAAGAKVEQASSEQRPLGAVSPISVALNKMREAVQNIPADIKGFAGETMPKTTAANREVGEAGARYLASRIAARPKAVLFTAKALQGTGVDPVKFGAALTEDNLRSIRESLRGKATELLAQGDEDGAAQATEKADAVTTIIGSKGSPFKTEDEYFDFLDQPDTKRAIDQHIQLWQEVVDPMYKQAASLDPDVELPSRGQQTGARINLKAVLPDEPQTRPVKGGPGAPSLTATFKRKTPFAIQAKGTGHSYDVDYSSIIANTFERQLEIANKNQFDKMLVESGDAVIAPPGQQVEIKGERGVSFPLERKLIITPSRTFPRGQNIYVRQRLAEEYRSASNVDPSPKFPYFSKVMNVLNRTALAGLTDATIHLSNQTLTLFTRPVSGKLFYDTLLSATGRADVPVTLVKTLIKAFRNNQEQVAELAEIAAMRPEDSRSRFTGKLLRQTDKLTRLMLDDTYQSLVKEGVLVDNETKRREYVNQIGQYNRRAQGRIMQFIRETGFGSFAVAGRTFNVLGVKTAAHLPGAEPANAMAGMALRVNMLSKWMGALVLAGTLNYIYTKDKGGGIMGRPGTRIGDIDMGGNDASGKALHFPLFDVLGLGRALRATGVRGAVESKRLGLTDNDAIDAASRDIINSWSSPFLGPAVRFGAIAASGYPPAVSVGRASRVAAPGESQRLANVKEALLEANPVVNSARKAYEGKPVHEILASQLPRFTLIPGKTESMVEKYPKIVSMAQGAAFIDDSIHEARRMPKEERRKFLVEQFKRLPASQRDHAWSEANRRRVFK